jgi:hypothetical protein
LACFFLGSHPLVYHRPVVWVCPWFSYRYLGPSTLDLSRVLGPDRMCCAKFIDASIPSDDMIPDEGIMVCLIG